MVRTFPAALVLALLLLAAPAAARDDDVIPGQYIVALEPSTENVDAEIEEAEREHGFLSDKRYRHSVKGFTAKLDRRQVEELEADPDVRAVQPDRIVRATAAVSAAEVPTGVARMQAAIAGFARNAATVPVAVIDTGIDLDHPDLVVGSGVNCAGSGLPDDNNGHGTHVAGSIGARNNGSGVVGVAPGTTVLPGQVLGRNGSGTTSQVICGIDWVAANGVPVANMSLSGGGPALETCETTSDLEHQAICEATAAGVTFVVAAGNSGWDFDYIPVPDVPAAYPEVLTVSAASDSDGRAGSAGANPTCRSGESDDRYASFSNYASTAGGQAHTIAGPGVCIRSTARGGGYTTMSGTSMASPHVAGLMALCHGEVLAGAGPCAADSAQNNVARLVADAQAVNQANTWFGFSGDPLHAPLNGRYYGHLAFAGSGAPIQPGSEPQPPAPTLTAVSAAPAGTTISSGSLRSGTFANLAADDASTYQVNSTTRSTRTTSWYGRFTGVPSTLQNLRVSYKGANSQPCTQVVAIYRWTTGTWITLDSRSVGTSEVALANLVPTGTLSAYRSSGGELRARVQCTRSSPSFYAIGNLLRVDYDRP